MVTVTFCNLKIITGIIFFVFFFFSGHSDQPFKVVKVEGVLSLI